jgi:hypothetical protein
VVEIQIHQQFPQEDWRRLVEQCGGNPLHLPQVYLSDRPEKALRFLVFSRAGSRVACGPAFLNTPRLHSILRRRRTLQLPTSLAGAKRSQEEKQGTYEGLVDQCRAMGCRRLVIGHAWGDSFQDVAPLSGHITDTIVEFVLDLRPDLDTLLAGMHKVHRKNIRRAQKQGLTLRVESTLSALLHLRRLQLTSAERAASRGQGFAVQGVEYFRRVHDRVYSKGVGEVLLAFMGEECVGALAYLSSGTKGITVRSGCTSKGYDAYAMYLLQFALLERAKKKGLLEINLGGVPAEAEREDYPQHGLYEFKRGFGGQPHLRNAISMNVR